MSNSKYSRARLPLDPTRNADELFGRQGHVISELGFWVGIRLASLPHGVFPFGPVLLFAPSLKLSLRAVNEEHSPSGLQALTLL